MWFPSVKAFAQSLFFLVITLIMMGIVTLFIRLGLLTLIFTELRGKRTLIIFVAMAFLIIPVLVYGYSHYFLFGKDKSRHRWLISIESLGMGIFSFLTLSVLIVLGFLGLWGLGFYDDLIAKLSYTDSFWEKTELILRYGDFYDIEDWQDGLLTAFLSVACIYIHHWKNLLIMSIKRTFRKQPK